MIQPCGHAVAHRGLAAPGSCASLGIVGVDLNGCDDIVHQVRQMVCREELVMIVQAVWRPGVKSTTRRPAAARS